MRFDLSSQAYFRNPAAGIARLRAAGAVVEVRFPIVGTVWTTTTQALADRVLKDDATFTLRRDDGSIAGFRWWMPRIMRTLANNMLAADEPDHRRLRDVVDEAFRRRAVLDLEPRILALAQELADDLFAAGTPADLVARYARILPLSVICELLGLPAADWPKFTAWASGFTRFTGALGFLAAIPRMSAMRRYLERQLDAARRSGGEGLIAELVRVERDGGRIDRDEMVSTLFLLLFAGHETTTHLISGATYELLKYPGCATGSPRTGAAPISRSRSSCGSSRRCSSPSRAMCAATSSSAACGCAKATGSCRCWPPRTSIRRRMPIPTGSTSRAGRTGISPSAPASISVSAISLRASRPRAPSRRCFAAGRRSGSRSTRAISGGASGRG